MSRFFRFDHTLIVTGIANRRKRRLARGFSRRTFPGSLYSRPRSAVFDSQSHIVWHRLWAGAHAGKMSVPHGPV